jgi:hypothetical protein
MKILAIEYTHVVSSFMMHKSQDGTLHDRGYTDHIDNLSHPIVFI